MNAIQNRLLGELIGLARATEGNEHLITPGLTAFVSEALAACGKETEEAALDTLLARLEGEKRAMVPDCYRCADPCGRTSAFDLGELARETPDIREQKLQLLNGLCALASADRLPGREDLLYPGLIAIGLDAIDPDILHTLVKQVSCP